jgi:death-on-curing protein
MSTPLKHPSVEAVIAIHEEVLAAHGGSPGLRSRELLESAVAAPQATMMGSPMISEPIEVAAAYLFYLCSNHAFVDGNKRVALATCLVFLSENDRGCRSLGPGRSDGDAAQAGRVICPGEFPLAVGGAAARLPQL